MEIFSNIIHVLFIDSFDELNAPLLNKILISFKKENTILSFSLNYTRFNNIFTKNCCTLNKYSWLSHFNPSQKLFLW